MVATNNRINTTLRLLVLAIGFDGHRIGRVLVKVAEGLAEMTFDRTFGGESVYCRRQIRIWLGTIGIYRLQISVGKSRNEFTVESITQTGALRRVPQIQCLRLSHITPTVDVRGETLLIRHHIFRGHRSGEERWMPI